MAYVLGVICADGCLVEHANGYHGLNITSKDLSWLELIKAALQAEHKISRKTRGYQLQIRNRTIYCDLVTLGLTPRKSKTLELPFVPPQFLPDFVRGYFDGDGTVWYWQDPRWRRAWQLGMSFYSGSSNSLQALRTLLQQHVGVSAGSLTRFSRAFRLRYAIQDSLKLYQWMYYSKAVLCLQRKRARFEDFLLLQVQTLEIKKHAAKALL